LTGPAVEHLYAELVKYATQGMELKRQLACLEMRFDIKVR
jgi:hypothetical protein